MGTLKQALDDNLLAKFAEMSRTAILNMLELSELAGWAICPYRENKSRRIDGANLPGAGWPRWGQPPEQRARLAHPCQAIRACEHHCKSHHHGPWSRTRHVASFAPAVSTATPITSLPEPVLVTFFAMSFQ